jgi:hypothetical protein
VDVETVDAREARGQLEELGSRGAGALLTDGIGREEVCRGAEAPLPPIDLCKAAGPERRILLAHKPDVSVLTQELWKD